MPFPTALARHVLRTAWCLLIAIFAMSLAHAQPRIAAKSWLLVDVTSGQILASNEPDERVELDAAELLRVFEAAVADPAVGDIPATAEVQAQLDANAPSPPLSRMTRIRGFAGGAGSWSTCVLSYWMGSDGPMRSLDVVTVEVVSGTDRSDTPSSTSRSRRGSDTPSDRWEVTRWLRGEPVRAPRGRAVPVAFFNGSGCSNPDREVSVPVPDGAPGDRVVSARGGIRCTASRFPSRATSSTACS